MRLLRFACLALGLALLSEAPPTPAQAPATVNKAPGVALRGTVIPTGFQGRRYSAMIQIAVAGSPLPNATWDLDASFQLAEQKAKDYSGRVVAGEPGTPVVFEFEIEFEPGAYALNLAARETTAGQSESGKLEGRWPDPNLARATVSPLVLLQPAQGAFVRGENTRRQGALAVSADETVKLGLPTALVGVVCRGSVKGALEVVRRLGGASSVDFEPITMQPGGDQCLQVRDIIPPETLGEGHFRYEVHVLAAGDQIATGAQEFTSGGS